MNVEISPALAAAILIPVADIVVGENDRKVFDPDELAQLAASIEANGLLEDLVVRPFGGAYQLVAGERRFRAMADILGWSEVPAKVKDMSDEAAAIAMFAENYHRVQLSPMEEAGAFQKGVKVFGWSVEEIAANAKVSVNLVLSRLRLLELIEDLQFLVNAGELPIGHAALLVPLDANRQRMALRVIRDNPSISRADFKAMADELFRQQSVEPLFSMEVAEFKLEEVAAPKSISRKDALALIAKLSEALEAADPDNDLIAAGLAAVEAERIKLREKALKAHATRAVQKAAA